LIAGTGDVRCRILPEKSGDLLDRPELERINHKKYTKDALPDLFGIVKKIAISRFYLPQNPIYLILEG